MRVKKRALRLRACNDSDGCFPLSPSRFAKPIAAEKVQVWTTEVVYEVQRADSIAQTTLLIDTTFFNGERYHCKRSGPIKWTGRA